MAVKTPPSDRPVELFGALAEPMRLEIVRRLEQRSPQAVQELATGLPVTRSAVSQHLRVLRDANLVQAERRGRNIYYSLTGGGLASVDDWVARYRRFESERGAARGPGRPHLRLASATVTVRDQDRSLAFYRDALGFTVVNDRRAAGIRWLSLAPPDGTAVIVLRAASAAKDLPYTGSWTGLMFMTDDIEAKFRELSERGVEFDAPPALQPWGGIAATFADIDGNRFGLVEIG